MRTRHIALISLFLAASASRASAATYPGYVCTPQYAGGNNTSLYSSGTTLTYNNFSGIGGGMYNVVCAIPYDDAAPISEIHIQYRLIAGQTGSKLSCTAALHTPTGAWSASDYDEAWIAQGDPATGNLTLNLPFPRPPPGLLSLTCGMSLASIISISTQ